MSILHFGRIKNTLPLILQEEVTECGHACIAMVSNRLGHAIDLIALRKRFTPSIRGISLRDIQLILEDLNFVTRAFQVPIEEIHLIACPAILYWNNDHFVVLKKVKKDKVIIHDPAGGVFVYRKKEVERYFTGVVLEIEPSLAFKPIKENTSLYLTDMIHFVKGTRVFLGLLGVLSLVIEILGFSHPLLLQYLTDTVVQSSSIINLYAIGMGFIWLTLCHTFFDHQRRQMIVYLSHHLSEKFTARVFMHLLKCPLDFFEKRSKGDLQNKFQSIDLIQRKISTDLVSALLDGCFAVLNITLMFFYSPLISLIVLTSLSVLMLLRYSSFYVLKKATDVSFKNHAHAASIFLETLSGIVAVKTYGKEREQAHQWRNGFIKALNADIRIARMQNYSILLQQTLSHLEQGIVMVVGAFLVMNHHLTLGTFMAILGFRQLLVQKASASMQSFFDFKLIAIPLNRLADIVHQQPENLMSISSQPPNIQGQLRLKNISFRYHERAPLLLHRLNIVIEPGEKIAIIGPSGAGKTTLLKIMMGLLQPTQGEVQIDQYAISLLGLKSYRQMTAAVMQEDSLFSGSIWSNIIFSSEQAPESRVYEAAQCAQIHDMIMQLPMGYQTQLGHLGSSISGGQKQRILLARALYRQPKWLFLDEATAHLDLINESKINQALKKLSITQIVIAHRQETIKMADRVIDLSVINQPIGEYNENENNAAQSTSGLSTGDGDSQ